MTVDIEEQKLKGWAAAGLGTPAQVDPDGHHMWDVEALRCQISRYVDTGGRESEP